MTNCIIIYALDIHMYCAVCGQDKVGETGVIESPNYPNPYPHSRNCEWRITVENGRQVLLNVTAFDIEVHTGCDYDYLEIRYLPGLFTLSVHISRATDI